MNIPFTKMQGLGNDFVVIDATKTPFNPTPETIRQMANRHLGVGFDQLLIIEPAHQTDADFVYRIFNADGNEVEQCGNGARCVARFIKERGLSTHDTLNLKTLKGITQIELDSDNRVSVNMGAPSFIPEEIPFLTDQTNDQYQIELSGNTIHFNVVNVGNPHAVIEVQNLKKTEMTLIGQQLATHPRFPEGVNVGFMQIMHPNHIQLHVYERGAGETLACGSGACAAVVVGRKKGVLDPCVTVTQPGGELEIKWEGPGSAIYMTGPADFVFHGEWPAK